jgi:hypothetical protein
LVDVHGPVVEADVDRAVWVVLDYAVDEARPDGVVVSAAMLTITVTGTVTAVGAGLTVSVLARAVEVLGAGAADVRQGWRPARVTDVLGELRGGPIATIAGHFWRLALPWGVRVVSDP